MEQVAYCILTRGRPDRQITLSNLPYLIRRKVILVVDEDEYRAHRQYRNDVKDIVAMPSGLGNWNGNFSDKKEWVSGQLSERYMFILDDDLSFHIRKSGRLIKVDTKEIAIAFNMMGMWLEDGFAHVSMGPREGNNYVPEDYRDAGRTLRVCGFDLDIIEEEEFEFNRLPLMADFDITLQLLEKGYCNRILYKYAQGQRKSNDDGGCSLYRTPELMTKAANLLKKLHPKFVNVVTKETDKPWAGFKTNKRTDVNVQWRKAYEYGKGKKKGIGSFLKS